MKAARLFLYAVVLFSACLLSVNTYAIDRAGTLTVSPLIGGYTFEGNEKLKTSMVYNLNGGYNFTDSFGVEAGLGFIDTGLRGGSPDPPVNFNIFGHNLGRDSVQVDGFIYKVDAVYHFPQIWKLSPYVAAGAGGLTLNPEKGKARTRAMIDYGGGVEYFLLDRLALRGDVRHIITFNDTFNNVMYTAGLIYYIGVAKPAPAPVAVTPPPPPPPAPAPVPPAPPAPKVEAPAPAQKNVCIVLKVLFDFDKSDIKPEYHDDIQQVADFLKANPAFKGVIEGNTDAVGTEEYNMGLSQRRAESVKKYLVDNFGIAADRLEAVGFGKYMPAATNLTEEGRQLNRRSVRVYCSLEGDIAEPPLKQYCVGMKVEFDSGSAEIKPQFDSEIRRVADYMNEHPTEIGTIEGYADGKGTEEYNMKLSQKRADAVKKYLVEKYNVPEHRLKTKALGKTRPIADNTTPEGMAQNRYAVEMFCSPEPK